MAKSLDELVVDHLEAEQEWASAFHRLVLEMRNDVAPEILTEVVRATIEVRYPELVERKRVAAKAQAVREGEILEERSANEKVIADSHQAMIDREARFDAKYGQIGGSSDA